MLNCILSLSWATIFVDSSRDDEAMGTNLAFSILGGFFLFLHILIFAITLFTAWGRNCMENRIIGLRFCFLSTASAGIATIVLLISRWIKRAQPNFSDESADKSIVFAVLMIVNIDMIRHFELSRKYVPIIL
jgi:hypothetical protein